MSRASLLAARLLLAFAALAAAAPGPLVAEPLCAKVFSGPAVLHPSETGLASWLSAQVPRSRETVLRSVGPSAAIPGAARGSVLASPSLAPNYRYHWVRDSALTMNTLLGLYDRSASAAERSRYLGQLLDYTDFSRLNQQTPNRSGPPEGLGLGEPKFNLDGTAFDEPWGRPQNDGPALRASTLIRLAYELLDGGQEAVVRQKLYSASIPAYTVIKADLEFVSHHWRDSSFDLWEETLGGHFYTRMVQRRALIEGAALAERLGDPGAAAWYRRQAGELEAVISRHWDASQGIVVATRDRVGGIDYKASGLDVAVILGALHGAVRGKGVKPDHFFAVTDERILATSVRLETAFKRLYPINGVVKDRDGRRMGTAIGRYPEDRFDGASSQGRGNPWFLATDAFAELYYRCGAAWAAKGRIAVTAVNAPFFDQLAGLASKSFRVAPGETIAAGDPRFGEILGALRESGDAYLRRTRYHEDPSGAISEQFNRDTGHMQSAIELTWSHASVLSAQWARLELRQLLP